MQALSAGLSRYRVCPSDLGQSAQRPDPPSIQDVVLLSAEGLVWRATDAAASFVGLALTLSALGPYRAVERVRGVRMLARVLLLSAL